MARPRTFEPNDVLLIARGLFWRKGYQGTSMKAIVHPIPDWSEWNPDYVPIFQGFRANDGEKMILDDNMFVEMALFGSNLRQLTDAEKTEYRRPFVNREDRLPTLSWPRQLPIAGEPPEIIKLVSRYGKWMAENDIPKLFRSSMPSPARS
jgi:haloalkane dehalogenase